MKLVNLIAFFRQGGTFEEFRKEHGLDDGAEVIEIYAQEPTDLESELGFFPIEETEGQIEFQSHDVRYHNLFDFFYFLDVVEEVKGRNDLSDLDLAQKLFRFAMKDA